MEQNYGFDLEGQGQGQGGQGPKFNDFYSRRRRNLSEILNDIEAKLWLSLLKVKKVKVQNLIISILGQDGTCLKF